MRTASAKPSGTSSAFTVRTISNAASTASTGCEGRSASKPPTSM